MIRGIRVGDSKADWHPVQKPDIRQGRNLSRKIIAHKKDKLVRPGLHLVSRKQGLIGAAIRVRAHGFEQRRFFAAEAPQLDLHAWRRTAVSGIQNVGAEFRGHKEFLLTTSDLNDVLQSEICDSPNLFKCRFDFRLP